MTARDDAAGLREGVEALAEEWGDEDALIEHVGACQDFACKTCVVAACAYDLRALLAESTPAPAPAADGGEVALERLRQSLRWHFACHAEEPEKSYASLGIANAENIVTRMLADIRRTARAEGAEEIAAAIEADECGQPSEGLACTIELSVFNTPRAEIETLVNDVAKFVYDSGREAGVSASFADSADPFAQGMLRAARIARATGGPQ